MTAEIQPMFVDVLSTAWSFIADEGPHKGGILRRLGKAVMTDGPPVRRPGWLIRIFGDGHPVRDGAHAAIVQIRPAPTLGESLVMQHHLLDFTAIPAPHRLHGSWQRTAGKKAPPGGMEALIHTSGNRSSASAGCPARPPDARITAISYKPIPGASARSRLEALRRVYPPTSLHAISVR
jgi:hypothetical protein